MNINPQAKVILCFGDSNTWGAKPDGNGRYAADVRWTGQLQSLLGDGYYVIEEGLGGRTTNLENPDKEKPGRSGLEYFVSCAQSHHPYNLAVIMLGTNDLKKYYNRSAKEIAEVLGQYYDIARKYNPTVKILLVSPAHVTAIEPFILFDKGAEQESRDLADEIARIAEEKQTYFLDAGKVTSTGEDGLHWDEKSCRIFAEQMEKTVREILS